MDLYELTMLAGYFERGMHERRATFDLSFRELPFQGGYAVMAGLDPALAYLESLRFDDGDLDYLESLLLFKGAFLAYLSALRFKGTVTAAPEGTIVFPHEPLLTVEGTLAEAQVVETALLNVINFQTLVATKAARVVRAAAPAKVVEFGARRAQGSDGALSATRAAAVGGVLTTSHLLAGKCFGLPVTGTQAHSWVMSFPTEIESFRAYATTFPDSCVLLVDTYDTLRSGVPNAILVAKELEARGSKLAGVRIDSGDLAYLSRETRRLLDEAGLGYVKIVASNELDEHVIQSIRMEGGRVDLYGVGTRLVTGQGTGGGALGGVYKLVHIDKEPKIKVSGDPSKSTIPGQKRVWRVIREGGFFEMDVIALEGEKIGSGDEVFDPSHPLRHATIPEGTKLEDIRTVAMRGGARSTPAPALTAIAKRTASELRCMPEGSLRLMNPHRYRVALSPELHALRLRLIGEARPR
ncbi:MAG TPA: nicotinate phosphoribosyltransferase [Methylomirabilota bacterium]|nr:nicotinate phosphoribosyltransferase [Methylomirabilota bacterium]